MTWLIVLVLSVLCASRGDARELFVAPAGNDAGGGTESEFVNQALTKNYEALKIRLRQLGFFTDLADASNSQVIAPRFTITHGQL